MPHMKGVQIIINHHHDRLSSDTSSMHSKLVVADVDGQMESLTDEQARKMTRCCCMHIKKFMMLILIEEVITILGAMVINLYQVWEARNLWLATGSGILYLALVSVFVGYFALNHQKPSYLIAHKIITLVILVSSLLFGAYVLYLMIDERRHPAHFVYFILVVLLAAVIKIVLVRVSIRCHKVVRLELAGALSPTDSWGQSLTPHDNASDSTA